MASVVPHLDAALCGPPHFKVVAFSLNVSGLVSLNCLLESFCPKNAAHPCGNQISFQAGISTAVTEHRTINQAYLE